MNSIELLAPGKDLECGIAAISCGADAVYLGAPQFGARENAGNSLKDIESLSQYAHKYWAKVYVTVNTLLRDEEIPQAVHLIYQLSDIGIDGLIIQDVGLLECNLPPIPLIASTQMHNNTPEKVSFLEKVGFQRAILARELDLDQIRAIRAKTKIELESFIHGALCVCYSGQCYLSYAIGGRSGNRGQCAQPCRKLYNLIDSNGEILQRSRHLLSLKDLNLSDSLAELIQAGITSFKIEGRLKDKTYVSNVVGFYRRELDSVLNGLNTNRASSGKSILDFEPNLEKTFNRGYTSYFLHGRKDRIGSILTPKMVGEPLGKIRSVNGNSIELETNQSIHPGDGFCFFDANLVLRGTLVNQVDGNRIYPAHMAGLKIGIFIYRNHDHEYLTQLEKSHPQRQIAVQLTLQETPSGYLLKACDEDNVSAEVSLDCEKTPAQKPDSALETIQKQLKKTGGTAFFCDRLTISLDQPFFIPISVLNSLRRDVLILLAKIREEKHPRHKVSLQPNEISYPEKSLSYLGNVLNQKARTFYKRHGVLEIEPAAESGLNMRGRVVMTTRYCLKHQLGLCPKSGKVALLSEPLFLIDAEGHKLELKFDCARCGMEITFHK